MEERYSRVGILDAVSVEPKNGVSVVAGALLYDTITQSKLIQLKLQNNSTHTLTGVLVKCVLYGENSENVLGETFYQYEGLHVASGEAFGEQTPIVIQTQGVQSFDVTIVNVSLEEAVVLNKEELSSLAVQTSEKVSDINFVGDNQTIQVVEQLNKKSGKKKLSKKGIIAGVILLGVLWFAFRSFTAEPVVGHWDSNYICNNVQEYFDYDMTEFEDFDLSIKRNGNYSLEIAGQGFMVYAVEGTWERLDSTTEEFNRTDKEYTVSYALYDNNGDLMGKLAYTDSDSQVVDTNTIVLQLSEYCMIYDDFLGLDERCIVFEE